MISLRPYQDRLATALRVAYGEGHRAPLVVLPTGGGKTTIFAYVTSSAAAKGRCVYLLAHRAELVKQIAMTLARFGCQHRIVAPGAIVRQCQVAQFKALGRSFVGAGRVYVCSAQTLVKRLEEMPDKPDIIVIDEAHHLTLESTWGRCVEAFPEAKLLPVTATPIR
ncbi:MAG: DEAD/DEAH box helicase family protein, partial [Burkholderiaceae bacterium]|nr:DEAD/DEAH box helicase family protein [Burkholderiaceae bacterium]